MRKPKKEIHLTSYEELLGIEDNQENSVDKITEIPIDCLYGFMNHPLSDQEKMVDMRLYLDTVESMHANWQEKLKYQRL